MDSWTRLEQVIKWTGLTTNAFALSVGLKRAENLYQIKKGRNAISRDLAELIAAKYPEINRFWLLTGEGTMFSSDSGDEYENSAVPGAIPCYGGNLSFLKEKTIRFPRPAYQLHIPIFSDCDFAVTWPGDSMAPEVTAGSVLILKEVSLPAMLPGEIYLIACENYIVLKRASINPEDEQSLLVTGSRQTLNEFIQKSAVRHLFLLKGVVSVKIF